LTGACSWNAVIDPDRLRASSASLSRSDCAAASNFSLAVATVHRSLRAVAGDAREPAARTIRAAIEIDRGQSAAPLNPLDPATQTPLQRALLEAVNQFAPQQLAASPALLAAVRAGFQTGGGRKLAFAAHILDASLVGDLSQPVPAANGAPPRRRLVEVDAPGEVDATFVFDPSIPASQARPAHDLLSAIAENSPTMRNVMAQARARVRAPLQIKVDPNLPFGAKINRETGVITVRSIDDPQQAASSIVFEASNAANFEHFDDVQARDVFLGGGQFLPGYVGRLDAQAADILQGALKKSPARMASFADERVTQADVRAAIEADVAQHSHRDARAEAAFRTRVTEAWKEKVMHDARTDVASLRPYLSQKFGAQALRLATHSALLTENAEVESLFNHHAIFRELDARNLRHRLTPGSEVLLNHTSILAMDNFRGMAPSTRGALPFTRDMARAAVVESQIERGHTFLYLQQRLAVQGERHIFESIPDPVQGAQAADESNADTRADTRADARADAGLEEAGAAAGRDSRSAIEARGAVGDGAARAAAEATLRQQSMTLAEKILDHPQIARALKVGGKGLAAAALAALVWQLGEAILTDVNNGDREAHATRKALAELLGGLLGGEGGALGGAALGAVIGSVVPGVGTAVGAFVGGLFGSALGFGLGSAAGSAGYGFTQKPIDALIDRVVAAHGPAATGVLGELLAEPRRNAARIVKAGSADDAQSNAGELRTGLEVFGYTVRASDDQLGRLISAYGPAGKGALGAVEISLALTEGALFIDADGAVRVDTGRILGHTGEQSAHIGRRVVNAGSEDDRLCNDSELREGFEKALYDPQLTDDDYRALIARYDPRHIGAISEIGLQQAIDQGVLVLHDDGRVTKGRAFISAESPSPGRPAPR
jgi:hypothetical protein